MKKLTGVSASGGVAIGKLTLCVSIDNKISKQTVSSAEPELARLDAAKEASIAALNAIYMNALKRVGEESSMIFQIHIMMLQDEDFFGAIQNMIREEKVNAEYAVQQTGKQFAEMFATMDDEYMRGRSADVIDISKRLIRSLNPALANGLDTLTQRTIVGAVDLMPSETVQMNPELVQAFVTKEGSKARIPPFLPAPSVFLPWSAFPRGMMS